MGSYYVFFDFVYFLINLLAVIVLGFNSFTWALNFEAAGLIYWVYIIVIVVLNIIFWVFDVEFCNCLILGIYINLSLDLLPCALHVKETSQML